MSAHPVEDIKARSARLRGSLLESLADPVTGALREDDQTLIKYHGSYQQDDRDVREVRRQAKLEPAHAFMIRTRTPGGVVTPAQWLQLDAIATAYAERGLRITTRQAFQFHGVIKRELKATMQAINAALIDTLAACGDVNRNIVASANPYVSAAHAQVHAQAAALSRHLLPGSRAYYEIWLDEARVAGSGEEHEPIYGERYLPRKFKIGFAIPPLNDVDVFAQDLGFIAILGDDGALLGYDVAVGGGMGASHGDPETYPRLGSVIGFVAPDRVVAVAEAVVTAQRDFGNREVRKRARLKYTIDDRGLDWFQNEVERRAGFTLPPARAFDFDHNGDRFGWTEGAGGRAHLTLRIPAGRIVDGALDGRGPEVRHLSGLRAIAQLLSGGAQPAPLNPAPEPARQSGRRSTALLRGDRGGTGAALPGAGAAEFRLTANQNLAIANVPAALRPRIDALVSDYGLDGYRQAGPLRRDALACVALPTCGLAMAEAERYLPDFVSRVEALLDRHGIADAPIHLRISGCPNGCSRPYLGEIALVGRAPGRYDLMLGADRRGQRLNVPYRENVDEAAILAALDPLLAAYARDRAAGQGFGDFLLRTGVVDVPADAVRHGIPLDLVA